MFTLANGLTVILHEDHSVPVVAVNVWYHVGSAREKPGRTGFAHLFEHLLFEGSKHVKEGEFDTLLEAAGGINNGSTTTDRTNYYESMPSNALDLALFLESDRMGYLLDVVTPKLVDGQRDVVKNERRQSYENAPYGMAQIRMTELMYPKDHPYHWPVIGYMEDLTAATHEDVIEFFKQYYAPGNASLVIAGDINPAEARKKVEHWFGDVKAGTEAGAADRASRPRCHGVIKETLTDRVQLPRLYLSWHTPALYAPGDAELDVAQRRARRRQELAALQAPRLRPAARAGRRGRSRSRRATARGIRSSSPRGRRRIRREDAGAHQADRRRGDRQAARRRRPTRARSIA